MVVRVLEGGGGGEGEEGKERRGRRGGEGVRRGGEERRVVRREGCLAGMCTNLLLLDWFSERPAVIMVIDLFPQGLA